MNKSIKLIKYLKLFNNFQYNNKIETKILNKHKFNILKILKIFKNIFNF
jgi:hypothetical protein